MKKVLMLLICISLFTMPAYCTITDDFAERSLNKDLKIKKVQPPVIEDDFVENTLNKNLKIRAVSYKPITDNFAENNPNKNAKPAPKTAIQENIPVLSKNTTTKKIVVFDTSSMQAVPVKIVTNYSTKQKFDEGDCINFVTTKDVRINNNTYPRGTKVQARIETISTNKSMGVPADLIVGNFSIDEIPLAGEICKVGANRSLWVRPCMYAFLLFWGAGLLFTPIRGGHAKINTSEVYTLYAK